MYARSFRILDRVADKNIPVLFMASGTGKELVAVPFILMEIEKIKFLIRKLSCITRKFISQQTLDMSRCVYRQLLIKRVIELADGAVYF